MKRTCENATEIVITSRNRLRKIDDGVTAPKERHAYSGSAGRAAAGAATVGAVLGAALTNRRELSTGEGGMLGIMGAVSIIVAVVAFMWPAAIGWPLAVIGLWLGTVWLLKALALWRARRRAPPPLADGRSSDV